MSLLGIFDPEIDRESWFAPEVERVGWWDPDSLSPAAILLSGLSVSLAQGTLARSITKALSGQSLTTSAGTLVHYDEIDFGNNHNGADVFPAADGRLLISPCSLASDITTIDRMYCWMDSTSTAGASAKMVVFTDNAGAPGTLVIATAGVVVPAGGGLLQFAPTGSSGALNAGNYWIGVVCNSFQAKVKHETTGTLGDMLRKEGYTYATPPGSWTPPADDTYVGKVCGWAVGLIAQSGASAALSGSAGTTAAGTLASTRTVAISGQSLTSAHGTISAGTSDVTVGLSGQSVGTVTQTLPAANDAVSVSGQSNTSAAGALAAALALLVTGSALVSSPGSLGRTSDRALTSQLATFGQGTVSASSTVIVALTGQSATASAGTVAGGVSLAVSGQATTASAGSVGPSSSLPLTSQALTTGHGSVAASSAGSAALSGQAIGTAAGTVIVSIDRAATGQGVTVSLGTTAHTAARALTGQALSGATGSVSAGADATAAITGQSLLSAAGDVSAGLAQILSGTAANTATGSAASTQSATLSGASMVATSGDVSTGPNNPRLVSITYANAGPRCALTVITSEPVYALTTSIENQIRCSLTVGEMG